MPTDSPVKSKLTNKDFERKLFKPTPVSVDNVGQIEQEGILDSKSSRFSQAADLMSLQTIVHTQEQQRQESGSDSTMSGSGLVYRSLRTKKQKPLP